MKAPSRLLIPLLIVLAVAEHWRRVDGVVDGEHSWRQAHVVANVDMMLQRGVLAVPATWNDDLPAQVFDFPLYQGIVAVLCRWSGAAPASVAETLSVVLFALTAVLVALLARLLGLSRSATAWSLVFFGLSPLARYWFAAALPDDLAMCCAVASACGWAQRARGAAGACAIGVWYGGAFVATLIKPPVFLPVAATIVAVEWWRAGLRGVRTGRVAGFAAIAVAAVIVMRVLTRASRGDGTADGGAEWAWYFGTTAERLSFDPHAVVLARIGKQAVTLAGLAAAAVLWCARKPLLAGAAIAPEAAVVLRVWSAAAVLGSLLFLHVNVVHSYYQLPCTLPFALAAGGGAALLCERIRAWSPFAPFVAAAVLLGATAALSEKYLARMTAPATREMRDAGEFLRAHTAPADYVVYVVAEPDGNPAFLYFAQRHGRNVSPEAITYDTVPVPPPELGAGRTLVYATKPSAARLLADQRWLRVAEHEHGVLLAARDR